MSPRGRPKVLGIGSPKGGVGKTQTAVTLAHLAHLAGHRVLLVDADENQSAHDWSIRAGDRMPFDIALERDPRNLVRLHDLRDVDLVVVDLPGARTSDAWEALLKGDEGRPVLDGLVVPTQVLAMDMRAVLRTIRQVVRAAGIPYLLVGTRVRGKSVPGALQDLNDIASKGVPVARTIIRDFVAHSDAVNFDRPITDVAGGRHSGARMGEREYRALAREVAALIDLKWPDQDDDDLLPAPIEEEDD